MSPRSLTPRAPPSSRLAARDGGDDASREVGHGLLRPSLLEAGQDRQPKNPILSRWVVFEDPLRLLFRHCSKGWRNLEQNIQNYINLCA